MKRVALFVLLVLALLAVTFVYLSSRPPSSDSTNRNFVINQGDGIRSISRRLETNGFIRNQFVFVLFAYQMGLNTRLQAGAFKISPSLSVPEIINKLSSAGTSDYWLKILEGQRIAELPVRFDDELEGYIFPDSYLIPQKYSLDETTALIRRNFDEKFTKTKSSSTTNSLSDRDIVILASLLEREARSLTSKQYVAGVLYNRLKINMALQVDATVQYARDSRLSTKDYWQPVTKNDLAINSPYNTYKIPGLPPGPICNPGYNSLYAAFHPIEHDYLFYITGNDNQMHYAKTLDEHNANIAKYLR